MHMTSINKKIMVIDHEKAMYDNACKNLLKEKQIMAHILKTCVTEFENCSIKDIINNAFTGKIHVGSQSVDSNSIPHEIETEDTEDSVLNEGIIRYDLRFTVNVPNTEEQVNLIINVEAQNNHYPGYDLVTRAIYYCSRLIAAQKNSVFFGSDYQNIRKVYSIWLCMNPPDKERNSISKYDIKEEMVQGTVSRSKKSFDLLSAVMVYLGEAYRKDYSDVIGLLSSLLSNEMPYNEKYSVLKDNYGIVMTEELERGVSDMCNLSKGVEERGIQKGILEAIVSIMDSLGLSVEQAMSALKISDEDKSEYEEMLRKLEL